MRRSSAQRNGHAKLSQIAPWYYLPLLILAGESVFVLPFVLARVFRPTVLEVFALDNVQLGLCFSVYGVVALLSYLFGGPMADRFPPRKLIAVALWMTALGGLVYAAFPSFTTLRILYGYWGFTTIFLFWAPMIKAARVWGGATSQGKAFGFLDGGRGLVAALLGAMGVTVFALFLPGESAAASTQQIRDAFRYVIWVSTATVAVVGLLVWLFMKIDQQEDQQNVVQQIAFPEIKAVLRLPSVWLLMVIILCAYVGYKITDVLSLYAQDVMEYDQVASAQVGTLLLFTRPVIGVVIGILADRTQTTLWLAVSFGVIFVGALLFASGIISASATVLFFLSILVVSAGVYAARSLYFAVMERGQIPLALTGTAVGLVSLVGYSSDIFAGPAMGYLLDRSPGAVGHQQVFACLAAFALVGGIAAGLYFRLYGEKRQA